MEKSAMKGIKSLKSKDGESSNASSRKVQLFITGYDNSLPEGDIKSALIKHFSPCREVTKVIVPVDTQTGGRHKRSLLYIRGEGGEGALEKAQKLNGGCECDVEGCKIVVDQVFPIHNSKRSIAQCGFSVSGELAKMAKEAKEAKD